MGWRRRGTGRLKEHRQPSRDNMGQELDTEFQTGDCLEVEFEATDLMEHDGTTLNSYACLRPHSRKDDEAPDDDGGALPRILNSN